jgi:hypothetical protein
VVLEPTEPVTSSPMVLQPAIGSASTAATAAEASQRAARFVLVPWGFRRLDIPEQ